MVTFCFPAGTSNLIVAVPFLTTPVPITLPSLSVTVTVPFGTLLPFLSVTFTCIVVFPTFDPVCLDFIVEFTFTVNFV